MIVLEVECHWIGSHGAGDNECAKNEGLVIAAGGLMGLECVVI